MGLKLTELAARLSGRLSPVDETAATGLATLDRAGPTDISFLAHMRYRKRVRVTEAAAVIVGVQCAEVCNATTRVVADPLLACARIAKWLPLHTGRERPGHGLANCPHPFAGIDVTAVVDQGTSLAPGVTVGEHSKIAAGCVLGPGVRVGAYCSSGSNVTLRSGVTVGNRVSIMAGAVLGEPGFSFVRDGDGWPAQPSRRWWRHVAGSYRARDGKNRWRDARPVRREVRSSIDRGGVVKRGPDRQN